MLDGALNAAIGEIYDAAIDPDAIPSVLRRLQHLTGSERGMLGVHNDRTITRGIAEELDPGWNQGVLALQHQNLWFQRRHLVPTGRGVLGETLVRREEWRGVELFEDYMRPSGCVHLLGLVIIREPKCFVQISLHRPETREPHGPEELRIADVLAGHLARAFRMTRHLEEARAQSTTLAGALDRLATGCLVIDTASRLIFANAEAEVILRRGRPLRVVAGRLAGVTVEDQAKWRALVGRLGRDSTPAGTAISLGGEAGAALRLLAVPLRRECGESLGLVSRSSGPLGLVVINGADQVPAPPEILVELFALTPSEAALALALANDDTLQTYADRQRRSLNTVKTHLKAVFAKTGTSRQSELVRLMERLSCARLED